MIIQEMAILFTGQNSAGTAKTIVQPEGVVANNPAGSGEPLIQLEDARTPLGAEKVGTAKRCCDSDIHRERQTEARPKGDVCQRSSGMRETG